MTDPTFETRAEMEAWAGKTARLAQQVFGKTDLYIIKHRLAEIRRVTLAHSHLIGEK